MVDRHTDEQTGRRTDRQRDGQTDMDCTAVKRYKIDKFIYQFLVSNLLGMFAGSYGISKEAHAGVKQSLTINS